MNDSFALRSCYRSLLLVFCQHCKPEIMIHMWWNSMKLKNIWKLSHEEMMYMLWRWVALIKPMCPIVGNRTRAFNVRAEHASHMLLKAARRLRENKWKQHFFFVHLAFVMITSFYWTQFFFGTFLCYILSLSLFFLWFFFSLFFFFKF